MKKILIAVVALIGFSTQAFGASAPDIRFDTATFAPGGSWPGFNSMGVDNTSFSGIGVSGFTFYNGAYSQNYGFLWLRNDTNDNGLGYCSAGESCGTTNTTGNGDHNELSNENKIELIRLTLPDDKMWTDIWVSSLDSSEQGTVFWSDTALPDLSGLPSYTFSATITEERSIFTGVSLATGWDSDAKYLFFAAGTTPLTKGYGRDNDYLVYGVSVSAVPEPEIYAMMGIGLGLLGWIGRRKRFNEAADA